MTDDRLFDDFPPVTPEEWRAKIIADLKGADFDKKLVWRTGEGFDVQPYYTKEDLELNSDKVQNSILNVPSRSENHWKIRQDLRVDPDPMACNCRIRNILDRGVEAIGLDLQQVEKIDLQFLENLFHEVNLAKVPVYFGNVTDYLQLYDVLLQFLDASGIDLSKFSGSLGMDPLGAMVTSGELSISLFDRMAKMIREAEKLFPMFRIITIHAGTFQNGGSTLSQELGYGFAMANQYMDAFITRGLSPSTIAGNISFSFTTGPAYFLEIAKLRAARKLWNAFISEWNGQSGSVDMHIQSRTASWNLALYDSHVNMLRTTTETMAASLGGSDVITVLPFDHWYRGENDFSSRIARNIQIILKDESYFTKVADPGAGSYYIEQLTESIGEKAWDHFLEVEQAGGFIEAFRKEIIQDSIAVSADQKRTQAATRRDTILGVNQYPAFSELLLAQDINLPSIAEPAQSTYRTIPAFRVADEIESLRIQTEKSGKRPKVFLLKYGDPAWRTARAMFAGNFFACAGYEILDNLGYESIEKGLKAAGEVQAEIVVLCSSDDNYKETAPEALDTLHKNAHLVIAGYPSDVVDELKEQGIHHFIHLKSNLLETLKAFHAILNIKN